MPESVGLDSARLQRLVEWQQRLVDEEIVPFSQVVIGRHGRVAHFSTVGFQDAKEKTPAKPDILLKMYSMTKPITCVGLMTLYEEGRFLLTEPVHKYLGPKWKRRNMCVFESGDVSSYTTVPCEKDITIRDLMAHTSGLTYGFDSKGVLNKVDAVYAKQLKGREGWTLEVFVDKLAELPLLCQPGSAWNYGFGIDVCGRLCEVLSGEPLDVFLEQRVFGPLRMTDTHFKVPDEKLHRVAQLYMPKGASASLATGPPPNPAKGLTDITKMMGFGGGNTLLEGGGGLYGTASDYSRFALALLQGGELDGQRVLSRKTVEYMSINHLPGNVDLAQFVFPGFLEVNRDGQGFGLGVSSTIDPAKAGQVCSSGTFSWGGAASTFFWCDPREDLFVVFTTQLIFRDDMRTPLRNWLNNLVYASLCDRPDSRRSAVLPVSAAARSKL